MTMKMPKIVGSLRQTVLVKWISSSGAKPARLKLECEAGSKTQTYDYSGFSQQADRMVRDFADSKGWGFDTILSTYVDSKTIAFAFMPSREGAAEEMLNVLKAMIASFEKDGIGWPTGVSRHDVRAIIAKAEGVKYDPA